MRALVLLCLAAASVAGLDVFGAAPGSFEDAVDTFTCDGTRTLPVARLNDDYCDCRDGTDEPGA